MRISTGNAREIRKGILDARRGWWDSCNFGSLGTVYSFDSLYRRAWGRTDRKLVRHPPKGGSGASDVRHEEEEA